MLITFAFVLGTLFGVGTSVAAFLATIGVRARFVPEIPSRLR